MSSTTAKVKTSLAYADNTTRDYDLPITISDITDEVADAVRANVIAINNRTVANAADFYRTFISAAGASVTSISAATIVLTEEEDIYGGDS